MVVGGSKKGTGSMAGGSCREGLEEGWEAGGRVKGREGWSEEECVGTAVRGGMWAWEE